ncbi:MAG: SH3 domain-containing protein, partial [Odoribacter sp.]|nr:SH3 domain-containing protein [Odoribacter sp.]
VEVDVKVDAAQSKDKNLAGTYTVTASALNLRAGAGTDKTILAEMPNGAKVQCYGYYTSVSGVKWLYVVYKDITGFASSKYLKK